jgi:hypothetical protein
MGRRRADGVRPDAWSLGAAMSSPEHYGARADGWPLPDAPIGRMTCLDCPPDGECDGRCVEQKFRLPTVAFFAVLSWFAVIGAIEVAFWFL